MIQPRDRILFQGDSITHAFRRPEEINNAFQMGNGYAFLIAAELLRSRPSDGLVFFNRGVCGDGIPKLSDRWQADCLDLKPTVLSILIGINDTLGEVDSGGPGPSAYAQGYRELLQRTKAALPGIRLVLCEPFALRCGMISEKHFPPLAARQAAVKNLAEEFQAVFVPLQVRLSEAAKATGPEYWAYDGVHATAAGFGLIAQAWREATGVER